MDEKTTADGAMSSRDRAEKFAWIPVRDTETLEIELRDLANTITVDTNKLSDKQSYFQSVREELKRRRDTKDERSAQPAPTIITEEAVALRKMRALEHLNNTLVNKMIAMEAEQAKLVVEVETHKFARREAEERLALVVKAYKDNEDLKNNSKST